MTSGLTNSRSVDRKFRKSNETDAGTFIPRR